MKRFLLIVFIISMLVLAIRTCSRKPQSITKTKEKAEVVKVTDKKTKSKPITTVLQKQIKEVIKAEKMEAMYLPGEINIDAHLISITLLMRTSSVTEKLLKNISYSLMPKLQKTLNSDRAIKLWFQRSLEGGKVMLYGNATLFSYSSKIEFKFY